MHLQKTLYIPLFIFLYAVSGMRAAIGQDLTGGGVRPDGSKASSIFTAVPFLRIAPDVASAAMGDVGAATTPDANSIFWNSAKYAFVPSQFGISSSYTPWLRKVVNDVKLISMAGYYQFSTRHTVAAGLRYFSWGDVNFTDDQGNYLQLVKPNEFAFDLAYAYQLAPYLSLSLTPKFIYSRLGAQKQGYELGASHAMALDLGFYAHHPVNLSGTEVQLAYGLTLSNMGGEMNYGLQKEKLPSNLRFGSSLEYPLDRLSSLSVALDINRLMVADTKMEHKKENALERYSIGTGIAYDYDRQFNLRVGYHHSNPANGDRRYFTTGAGIGYGPWNFGLAYILPTGKTNPLANTLRFSLSYAIASFNSDKD